MQEAPNDTTNKRWSCHGGYKLLSNLPDPRNGGPIYRKTNIYIKTNKCHIHTSIVSGHLATRGNNKILRTPPPHISSSEEILPASLVSPLPNSEQTNHHFSNHTYMMSTTNHTYQHHAPFVTHTTHIISYIVTPGFVDRPCRGDCTTGQMNGAAGWWITSSPGLSHKLSGVKVVG